VRATFFFHASKYSIQGCRDHAIPVFSLSAVFAHFQEWGDFQLEQEGRK